MLQGFRQFHRNRIFRFQQVHTSLHPQIAELHPKHQALGSFRIQITKHHLAFHVGTTEISRRLCLNRVINYVLQRTNPQLNRAIDATQSPHVLVFQVTAIAPAIHLHSQAIASCMEETGHVELSRRHRILAITHLLPIHPHIHRRLHASKMKDDILFEFFFRNCKISDIRTHRIAMIVCIPIMRWLTGHTRLITHERKRNIGINRLAIALHLPVSRHGDEIPTTHIVIGTIEISRARLRVFCPMETPPSIKRTNLLALTLS